jgi:lipopolysaccharide transport system permease protein
LASGDLTRDQNRGRAAPPTSAFKRNIELLRELVRRDLQSRHKGSALGALWSLLNPLLYMIVYTAVFSRLVRFGTSCPSGGAPPYPVFLLSALLAWNFFSQGVGYGLRSVTDNATLVKKVAFPRVLLTLSATIAALANYLISLVLLVPLLIFFHIGVGLPLLLAPLLILIVFGMTFGLGLLVAAGNVYFRDVDYIQGIALQVWFFLTPIIYPLALVAKVKTGGTDLRLHLFGLTIGPFAAIAYLNPLTWISVGFQDIVACNFWPAYDPTTGINHAVGLGYAAVVAALLMGAGLLVFRRAEGRFAEEL